MEKELMECLNSIALSLRNMDRKMDDMTNSLRELALAMEDNKGLSEDKNFEDSE